MKKRLLLTSLGLSSLLFAGSLQAQTTLTANLDETMRVQKGPESGTVYEAAFQGGTTGGFQGLKSMRSMVEKVGGFPPVNTPETAPIGWTGSNVVHGLSVIFTPNASQAEGINSASAGQLKFEFSVANIQGTGADGQIDIYLTRVGTLIGGNTGPNGGNWGGYRNYNGTGEGYEANPASLIGSIDPTLVQSYSFDVTFLLQILGPVAVGDEIAFLMIMQDDVVTAGALGDAITNSIPGSPNRTNIELGNALDQSAGPRLTGVPEPSTYAAVLGALALGFMLIRRRK